MSGNINSDYYKERIRQAKLAFNAALIAAALSSGITLTGIGLLYFRQISEGVATTAGGLASNVAFAAIAKDANNRLDEAMDDWNQSNQQRKKQ